MLGYLDQPSFGKQENLLNKLRIFQTCKSLLYSKTLPEQNWSQTDKNPTDKQSTEVTSEPRALVDSSNLNFCFDGLVG